MPDYIEPVITPAELADRLRCSMNSVYKLLNSGDIKAFRLGRSWKIPKRSAQEYVCRKSQLIANGWI